MSRKVITLKFPYFVFPASFIFSARVCMCAHARPLFPSVLGLIFSCLFLCTDRSEVQLQINHGVVVDHQMVVDKKDPLYVVNIKRAIASQLQLPILPADKYDDIVVQVAPSCFSFCVHYTYIHVYLYTNATIISSTHLHKR